MVDLPPQALLNRLRRGVIYPQEKAQQVQEDFFKEPTLVTLRELALRQTAHEVDVRHEPQKDAGLSRFSGRAASLNRKRAEKNRRTDC